MTMEREFTLQSYGADEGPAYPHCNKKGDVGGFFRALQRKELYACTKGIFAPVKLTYNATKENKARFNREYAYRGASADRGNKRDVQRLFDFAQEKERRFHRVRCERTSRVLMQALAA